MATLSFQLKSILATLFASTTLVPLTLTSSTFHAVAIKSSTYFFVVACVSSVGVHTTNTQPVLLCAMLQDVALVQYARLVCSQVDDIAYTLCAEVILSTLPLKSMFAILLVTTLVQSTFTSSTGTSGISSGFMATGCNSNFHPTHKKTNWSVALSVSV